jgi:hypothetical protein
MSLREIYEEQFGEAPDAATEKTASEEVEITKEAADAALEKAVEVLTPEEAEKVAEVVGVFDEEGLEFDHDLHKLAAAAQIVDEYAEYQESEKTAAEELDAAGRIMAHALADELSKIASPEGEGEGEAAPEGEEKPAEGGEAEGGEQKEEGGEEKTASLLEKLSKAVEE